MNETNQTEDPNLEWNKENPELNEENPEDELHGDLNQLRILSDELKNTKEPSWVFLTTSLQNIIDSINIDQSEITKGSNERKLWYWYVQRGYKKPEYHTSPTVEQIYISENRFSLQMWGGGEFPSTGVITSHGEKNVGRDGSWFFTSLLATMSRSHSIFSGNCGMSLC